MGFFGLDLLAIQHLSRQLETQSREVTTAAAELTNLLNGTAWVGADRERFVQAWQSEHLPALRRSAGLLHEASQHAAQGAVAQEQASRR
jgi:hypothetical protein